MRSFSTTGSPNCLWLSILVMASSPSWSHEVKTITKALPEDVRFFMDKRERCDHFRGEDTYDENRAKEIQNQLTLFCRGTDVRLAGLKRRYQGRPDIMRALAAYDEKIE